MCYFVKEKKKKKKKLAATRAEHGDGKRQRWENACES